MNQDPSEDSSIESLFMPIQLKLYNICLAGQLKFHTNLVPNKSQWNSGGIGLGAVVGMQ